MSDRTAEADHEAPEAKFTGLSVDSVQAAPPVESLGKPAEPHHAGLARAREQLTEVVKENELGSLIEGMDYSDPKNYFFIIGDSYHGKAATGTSNTRYEGKGNENRQVKLENGRHVNEGLRRPNYPDAQRRQNQWGEPTREAHLTKQAVEKAGIRSEPVIEYEDIQGKVRADGWRGKLGFTKSATVRNEPHETGETNYTFDYAFAAPDRGGDEVAQAADNFAGQHIELSVRLTQEQAHALSAILAENPTAARSILDDFVGKTGDKGKWEAEIYDEEGNFYDPGERYGPQNMVARDVRPNYSAVPDLKPEIIGLVEAE